MKLSIGNIDFVASHDFVAGANDDAFIAHPASDELSALSRIGKGDTQAFAEQVRERSPSLYRVAFRMLGDRAEAEDIVQEAFARLWKSAPELSEKGAGLVGWLHRVTMNLCFDRLRRPKLVYAAEPSDVADASPLPDHAIHERELTSGIENALATLSDRHRAALVLTYMENLPNSIAAAAMDLHIKAFESLLVRSRQKLREALALQQIESRDLEILA